MLLIGRVFIWLAKNCDDRLPWSATLGMLLRTQIFPFFKNNLSTLNKLWDKQFHGPPFPNRILSHSVIHVYADTRVVNIVSIFGFRGNKLGSLWTVSDVISKTFMRISMEDLKVLLAWVFTNFPEIEYFGDPFLLWYIYNWGCPLTGGHL
jgi:hypothetical protein